MITIGIELNHVVRNFNKQILKYYKKEFGALYDVDEIDNNVDVFSDEYTHFESNKRKNEFIYIDYPYEIFGCAKPIDKNLPTKINNWLSEMTNIEDDDIRVIYYSMGEEALTIQSSFFFLSKIGTRVREVIFPNSIEEIEDKFDVVITANPEVIDKLKGKTKIVKINMKINEDKEGDYNYDSLTDIIEDETFLPKIIEEKQKANE